MDDAPTPASADAARRALDAAIERQRQRLARRAEPPWLPGEVAERMAERLPLMRTRPGRWIDWEPDGAGAATAAAARHWPADARVACRPDPALLPGPRGGTPPADAGTPGDAAAKAAAGDSPGSAGVLSRWLARLTGQARAIGRSAGAPASTHAAPRLASAMPAACADAVWANLPWSLLADAPATLAEWHRLLAPDGLLMFTTFGPDTLRELRGVYAASGFGPPHPGFADMHDLGDALVAAGFADPVMDQHRLRLRWSGADAMLAELRGLGGNVEPRRFAGLRTPRWRRGLVAAIDAGMRDDAAGGVAATFELVFGHAFKPPGARAPRVGDEAVVALDALRATLPSARGRDGRVRRFLAKASAGRRRRPRR